MNESHEMVIIIRPSFKKFCGQDACQAALFNHFLYWISQKAKGQAVHVVKNGEVSWYGTADLICQGMDNSWSVNKVRKEIKALVDAGLIGQRRNPNKGWDQTRHYFFGDEQGKVLKELSVKYGICLLHLGLAPDVIHLLNLVNAIHNSGKCNCQISEMDSTDLVDGTTKSGNAIPKEFTKVSSKDNKGSTRDDNDSSISKSSLEEERFVWSSICQARSVKGAKPTKKEKEQITELTELIHLQDMRVSQFTSAFIKDMWAYTLAIKHYTNETWSVKNLINALPEYVASLIANQEPDEPETVYTEQELDRIVWWTREPDTAFYGPLEDNVHLLERLTIREARRYRYGEFTPFTNEEEEKITRWKQEAAMLMREAVEA